jgi:hypothetical protein
MFHVKHFWNDSNVANGSRFVGLLDKIAKVP